MIVNFIVQIPVANPVKFTLDGVPDDHRASYDKRRYYKTINATTQQRSWPQPFESADTIRVQYYSNYPLQRLQVVDCDNNIYQTYTPAVAVQYKNKKYRSDAKFYSIDDKLFIYFADGVEYSDEDFLVSGDTVDLQGRLPNINALPGDILRFKIGTDFQAGTIDSVQWVPSLQAQGYLTDVDYTLLNPVDGLVEISYDEKPANLYSQLVPLLPLLEKDYFIKLAFGVNGFTRVFTSEKLDVKVSHPKTLAIEYRHNGTFEEEDIWSYIYLSDWTNIIRMPTDFYEIEVAGEVDLDTNDNGVPRMLRAVPYRQINFKAHNIPGWLVDKLSVVFSHDSKRVNEYFWENETLGEFNIIARADLGIFEIKLRQVNDRTNFTTEFTEDVTAEFDPDSFEDLDFAGEVVEALFISNTSGVFSFVSLPSWIETDVDTFQNGDTIQFTIAANATFFDRTASLIAISESFDGLQATISFEQLFDDSVPEFLSVDDEDITLDGDAGSNQLVNVSSSGDYDITFSGAHTFTAAKESGFAQVRISEPTDNTSGSSRTGTVRLTLQSNPSIFVDISVSQLNLAGIISLTPSSKSTTVDGEIFTVDVVTRPGIQWQMSTPDTWLFVDATIRTGSATVSITILSNETYNPPRDGSVLFYNILDAGDNLTLDIHQDNV